MPPEVLHVCPATGPDVAKNRAEARELMKKAGYGPDKRLAVKMSTRNIAVYRDPAVILIDQLREVYIDGELDVVDTAQLVPEGDAQGLQRRAEPHRQRSGRSGPVNSTRTIPAARSATTPATAIRRSTS